MVPARILPGTATNLEADELHIDPTMDNIEDLNWGGELPNGGGPGDNPKEPETPSDFDPTTIIHDIPDGDGMEPGIPDGTEDPDNIEVNTNENPDGSIINNDYVDVTETEEAYNVAVKKKNLGLLLLGAAALFLISNN